MSATNALADVRVRQSRYDKAETLLLDVIEKHSRIAGADNPATLTAQGSLARLYAQKRDLAGAEKLFETVLAARRRILGREHPETLLTFRDLGQAPLDSKMRKPNHCSMS